MRPLTILAAALSCMVLSAHGQGASRLPTGSPDQKQKLQEAADKVRQAQSNGELDKAKETAKGLLGTLPSNLTDAAKAALHSPEAKAKAAEAAKSLLPEAQRMMNARNAAAAEGAAATNTTAADQPPGAAEGPKPALLQPLADSPPEVASTRKPMVVIEADNSVFNPDTNVLIYTGNVRARHPQFYIECEELIVHLNPEEEDKKKDAPPPGKKDPILVDKPEEKPNPVKKAIASGPMVRIEKANPEGKLQRAFCRNAVYEGATGLITMRDNPQVQMDNVMQTAISPDTIMTFDQKGKFNSNRPTRTVILSND